MPVDVESGILSAMWNLNYSSIKEISEVLSSHNLAMTKKFGQNFLIQQDVRERIASLIGAKEGMKIWEIGPGLGAITSLLLSSGASVTAFEIDHGFASILRNEAFADEDFTLVEGDALSTVFEMEGRADAVVGNLPYNVGSQIIARLIERGFLPEKMVFTLQKEVGERMIAKPSDKEYSSFSFLTQIDYENEIAFTIKPGSFFPSPRVDSAVIVMRRKDESLVEEGERESLIKLIRSLFAKRRKTIRNNLLTSSFSSLGKERIEKAFEKTGLNGGERAETLSYETVIALMRNL